MQQKAGSRELACGFLDLGEGLAKMLHTLHACSAGLVLVLQIPLLLLQHSCREYVVTETQQDIVHAPCLLH